MQREPERERMMDINRNISKCFQLTNIKSTKTPQKTANDGIHSKSEERTINRESKETTTNLCLVTRERGRGKGGVGDWGGDERKIQ